MQGYDDPNGPCLGLCFYGPGPARRHMLSPPYELSSALFAKVFNPLSCHLSTRSTMHRRTNAALPQYSFSAVSQNYTSRLSTPSGFTRGYYLLWIDGCTRTNYLADLQGC